MHSLFRTTDQGRDLPFLAASTIRAGQDLPPSGSVTSDLPVLFGVMRHMRLDNPWHPAVRRRVCCGWLTRLRPG